MNKEKYNLIDSLISKNGFFSWVLDDHKKIDNNFISEKSLLEEVQDSPDNSSFFSDLMELGSVPVHLMHAVLDKQFPKSNWAAATGSSGADVDTDISELGIEQGPLIKSEDTKLLESVIEKLIQDEENKYSIKYQNDIGEMIVVPLNINLSVLLKKANVNHLYLSDSAVAKFQHLASGKVARKTDNVDHVLYDVIQKIPAGLQLALRLYTEDSECNYLANNVDNFLTSETAKLHVFMLCFGAVALRQLTLEYANKMSEIYHKKYLTKKEGELKIFHETYMSQKTLCRSDPMKWFRGLINESVYVRISGFVSTAYTANVNKKIKVINAPGYLPTIEPISAYTMEHEVLLPPGGQYIVRKKQDNQYEMICVNTPSFSSPLDYHLSCALRYAFIKHLSKPFAEDSAEASIVIGGRQIYRPNHALAHTLRQIFYVKPIMDYFAHYAVDPEFAIFCRVQKDLFFIQLALIFSVTGRESEIGFSEDPIKYRKFREKSAADFRRYAESINMQMKDILRFERLVLYMGNPIFPLSINISNQSDFNKADNYIFYIMTLAHKLDLPRCYSISMFENSLRPYTTTPLIKVCSQQESDFFNLKKYAVQLIVATHDRLTRQFSNDYHIPSEGFYDETFADISLKPSSAEKVLESIPVPTVKKLPAKSLKRRLFADQSVSTDPEATSVAHFKIKPG